MSCFSVWITWVSLKVRNFVYINGRMSSAITALLGRYGFELFSNIESEEYFEVNWIYKDMLRPLCGCFN